MKLPDSIARLAALAPADRKSVLDALSSQARERLLRLMRSEHDAGQEASARVSAPAASRLSPLDVRIEELAKIPASTLAEILAGEPIWMSAALLRVADWPWRKQLLQRLPHVAVCLCPSVEEAGTVLTERFTLSLLERITARAALVAVPVPGRFEQLVQKMAARRTSAWHSF
jgi:hypothetical protein